MPYSHSTALLALRAVLLPQPSPSFATPPAPDPFPARSLPVAGVGSQEHSRMLGGARTATLGLAHPLQAGMWGLPGQLAACWAASLHRPRGLS